MRVVDRCIVGSGAGGSEDPMNWCSLRKLQLVANPRVIELAEHRSILGPKATSYWFEPQVTGNRDFTRIGFTSSWGSHEEADINASMLQLPANAIQ